MKKLLKFMACALAVSFGLTACDNGEEPHHPYDSGYNPKGSQLNTSHKLVGQMYGVDGVTENPEEAQGIVFAVSKDGQTAYLVSFTDAMVVGAYKPNEGVTYSYNKDFGYAALTMAWGLTVPTDFDTVYKQIEFDGKKVDTFEIEKKAVIHNVDGEINTDLILKTFKEAQQKDTTITLPKAYAAQLCRNYYRREWSKKRDDGEGANNDQLALKWKHTQGQWYLPSIEELGDLMKNKDKINKKYGNENSDFINDKKDNNGKPYFFMKIGGANNHAYWSSSEYNLQTAWYCLPNPVKGNGTYPGNSRYSYFQKNDRTNMYVRPIRKAPIK